VLKRLTFVLLGLNLVCAALIYALNGPAWAWLEQYLSERLRKALGPAERYQVRLEQTSWLDLLGGRLRFLDVKGSDVATREQLSLQSFSVSVKDLQLTPWSLKHLGFAWFRLCITERSLNDFLRAKARLGFSPSILLLPGRVELRARGLGFGLPLQVQGKLKIQDGVRLYFVPDDATVGVLRIPKNTLDLLLTSVNPVLNLEGTPIGPKLTKLHLTDQLLQLSGQLSPKHLPLPLREAFVRTGTAAK